MGKSGSAAKAFAGLAGLALVATTRAAAAPSVAEEVGGWQVDFGDQRCVALREYRLNGKPMVLAIEPDPDQRGVRLLWRAAAGEEGPRRGWAPAKVTLDDREVASGTSLWAGENGGQLHIATARPEVGEAALALSGAREVGLVSRLLEVKVPLRNMDKVSGLLADCNSGLLAAGGFSKEDQARLVSWPQNKLQFRRMITFDDYPIEAFRARAEGEVRVRLDVSADGRVTGCTVRGSSGHASLDIATCRLLQARARFNPARDKGGAAMAAPAFTTVRWLMGR